MSALQPTWYLRTMVLCDVRVGATMTSDNPYASPAEATSPKNRLKWIPTLAGGLVGLASGFVFLFQPTSSTPGFILYPVQYLSGWMQRVFMPHSDPMAAIVFEIPLLVIVPTLLGVSAGFLLQVVAPKSRS